MHNTLVLHDELCTTHWFFMMSNAQHNGSSRRTLHNTMVLHHKNCTTLWFFIMSFAQLWFFMMNRFCTTHCFFTMSTAQYNGSSSWATSAQNVEQCTTHWFFTIRAMHNTVVLHNVEYNEHNGSSRWATSAQQSDFSWWKFVRVNSPVFLVVHMGKEFDSPSSGSLQSVGSRHIVIAKSATRTTLVCKY